jgi:hypothetical protein
MKPVELLTMYFERLPSFETFWNFYLTVVLS